MARSVRENAGLFANTRWAVVADQLVHLGIVRQTQTLAEPVPISVRFFSSHDRALEWLEERPTPAGTNRQSTSLRARERIFLSFDEADRAAADAIRARTKSASDTRLDFDVVRGVERWETISLAGLRSTVVRAIEGATRTVVLVGDRTHASKWVIEEISATIAAGRPVYAIRLPNTTGPAPALLDKHRIPVAPWSLEQLQLLATGPRRRRKT
jgi:hypothetical protein